MIKETPFLIAGWSPCVGEVGWRVLDYINKYLSASKINEIEPFGFFSLGGVEIKNDIIQFPVVKYYFIEEKNLILFKSNQPNLKRYQFLNLVLDIAWDHNVQGVCTVGGMVSMMAHTEERKVMAVFNSPELKESFKDYDLEMGLDYQGSTSMSGFLLWVAKKKNIPAVSFWVHVPFYLAEKIDPKADKAIINILNKRFKLNVDLKDLDQDVEKQEERISRIRKNSLEVDECITKLENNLSLTQEEIGKLVKELDRLMA